MGPVGRLYTRNCCITVKGIRWKPLEQAELQGGNKSRIRDEFGDLLFSLVNLSRFIDVNPDEALEQTNRKFINRFRFLENAVNAEGKKLNDMTLAEMDVYWDAAKKQGL